MQTSTRQTSTRRAAPVRPKITSLPVIAAQMADAKAQLIADEAKRLAAIEAEQREAEERLEMARVAARFILRGFR